MIIEGVQLNIRRLPRGTFLSAAAGAVTIAADNTRRAIRLVCQDPNLANTSSWTGCVKRTNTPGGPVTNFVVLSVNQGRMSDEIDFERYGDLVLEAFTFVPNIAGGDAYVWEIYTR